MTRHARAGALVLAALLAIGTAGCAASETASTTTAAATQKKSGTITVSAAASLTEAFNRIGQDFTAANGTKVEFNYDSSTTLANQIVGGAPVDAFASADTDNMKKLSEAGLVAGEPIVFATNELVIVTKPGNPKAITGLDSLANAGTIAICGPDVPIGKYAAQALQKAGVTIPESNITRAPNVKAALTAVTDGDAVAGIVYATDAKAAGAKAEAVKIPESLNVIATFPAAAMAMAQNPEAAQEFIAYLEGPAAQATLNAHGFLPPP